MAKVGTKAHSETGEKSVPMMVALHRLAMITQLFGHTLF